MSFQLSRKLTGSQGFERYLTRSHSRSSLEPGFHAASGQRSADGGQQAGGGRETQPPLLSCCLCPAYWGCSASAQPISRGSICAPEADEVPLAKLGGRRSTFPPTNGRRPQRGPAAHRPFPSATAAGSSWPTFLSANLSPVTETPPPRPLPSACLQKPLFCPLPSDGVDPGET